MHWAHLDNVKPLQVHKQHLWQARQPELPVHLKSFQFMHKVEDSGAYAKSGKVLEVRLNLAAVNNIMV